MAAASSSSFSETEEQPQRYQVFLSSHLRDCFHRIFWKLFGALKNDNIDVHTVVTSEDNINIFVDNDGDKDEPLETLLLKIEESRIALAIISTKYIKSKDCLRELAFMKYCVEKGKLVVIPIFYRLDYKYLNHEVERDVNETKECTQVLKWIRDLDGIIVKYHSPESEAFYKIAKEIKNVSKKLLSQGSRKASVDPSENIDSQTSSGSEKIVDVSQKATVDLSENIDPQTSSAVSRPITNSGMECKVKPPKCQVFISFRGDQLRNSFVGYLVDALRRNEINVFIDNQEKRGEDLNTLFKRIEGSGLAIVVFSSRYTESQWCLEELVKIKERVDQGMLKVLPIFYKVTPTNVKRLQGEFGDHFRDKEYTYRSDEPKIKRWKEAIMAVSQKFALSFDEKSGVLEIQFVENIVKEVLNILPNISLEENVKLFVKNAQKKSK